MQRFVAIAVGAIGCVCILYGLALARGGAFVSTGKQPVFDPPGWMAVRDESVVRREAGAGLRGFRRLPAANLTQALGGEAETADVIAVLGRGHQGSGPDAGFPANASPSPARRRIAQLVERARVVERARAQSLPPLADEVRVNRIVIIPSDEMRFSGQGPAGARIVLRHGGEILGTALSGADGRWAFRLDKVFDAGDHRVTASVPAGRSQPERVGPDVRIAIPRSFGAAAGPVVAFEQDEVVRLEPAPPDPRGDPRGEPSADAAVDGDRDDVLISDAQRRRASDIAREGTSAFDAWQQRQRRRQLETRELAQVERDDIANGANRANGANEVDGSVRSDGSREPTARTEIPASDTDDGLLSWFEEAARGYQSEIVDKLAGRARPDADRDAGRDASGRVVEAARDEDRTVGSQVEAPVDNGDRQVERQTVDEAPVDDRDAAKRAIADGDVVDTISGEPLSPDDTVAAEIDPASDGQADVADPIAEAREERERAEQTLRDAREALEQERQAEIARRRREEERLAQEIREQAARERELKRELERERLEVERLAQEQRAQRERERLEQEAAEAARLERERLDAERVAREAAEAARRRRSERLARLDARANRIADLTDRYFENQRRRSEREDEAAAFAAERARQAEEAQLRQRVNDVVMRARRVGELYDLAAQAAVTDSDAVIADDGDDVPDAVAETDVQRGVRRSDDVIVAAPIDEPAAIAEDDDGDDGLAAGRVIQETADVATRRGDVVDDDADLDGRRSVTVPPLSQDQDFGASDDGDQSGRRPSRRLSLKDVSADVVGGRRVGTQDRSSDGGGRFLGTSGRWERRDPAVAAWRLDPNRACRSEAGVVVTELPGTYTVAYGDTLWSIAERHYGDGRDYGRIYWENRKALRGSRWIYPCQRLTVPRAPRRHARK